MEKAMNLKDGKHMKFWLPDLEFSAFEQARNVAVHPATFRHVAIMPDSHAGMGVPIGCVFASETSVIPNAVGVDIGCGMTARKLNCSEDDIREHSENIDRFVQRAKILSVRRDLELGPEYSKFMLMDKTSVVSNTDTIINTVRQLGTLGGGNHFIEFQKDENDDIWLMVHSGSRNLGQVVGKHYDKVAQELNAKYFSEVNPKHKLAFLPLDSDEGRDYIVDMNFCVEYAEDSRNAIIDMIFGFCHTLFDCSTDNDSWYNCTHNFAQMENHFSKNVMVHRKGATMARKGQIALIPGSQGTCSYIVEGLGNKDSFNSCSHGAGRLFSRTVAKQNLDLGMQKAMMDDLNIIHSMTSEKHLDEAAGAYKDIDEVMANQSDLVEIKHKLRPIKVIKN